MYCVTAKWLKKYRRFWSQKNQSVWTLPKRRCSTQVPFGCDPFQRPGSTLGIVNRSDPKVPPPDPLKVTSTDKQYLSISAMARGLHRNSGEVQRVASKNPWIKCLWTTLHSPDYTKVICLAYKWSEVERKSVGLYRCYKTRSVFWAFSSGMATNTIFSVGFL